jgi:hypothetical protein
MNITGDSMSKMPMSNMHPLSDTVTEVERVGGSLPTKITQMEV